MIRFLLTFFLFFNILFASISGLDTTKELLEQNNTLLLKQYELIKLQQKEIDRISECLDAKLSYKQKIYYVTIKCNIQNYAIDDNSIEFNIIKDEPTKINKTFKFEFKPELKERPYEIFNVYFKLGGTLYYEKYSQKIMPDSLFAIEFFSFDKIIPFYGLSLNGVIGLRNAGLALSYQFIYTKYFNNTSILAGYTYNYFDKDFYPMIGIALNF